ncbi:MAG TPA: YraN family protein [Desulfobacteria bacterium]|nr:YraN family protein [Desulfobacteria bacterium]
MDSRRKLGRAGEDMALNYLKSVGMQLLERNYRCRLGEIDLVMVDRGQLVFVEVRTKSSKTFGTGLESITSRKRRKLKTLARYYMMYTGLKNDNIRFDVVSIEMPYQGIPSLEHVRAAF